MNRRQALLLAPFGVALVAGAGFWTVLGRMKAGRFDPHDVPSQLIGRPVPEFALPSQEPGEGFGSADILALGRPVLINFFASWCVPCQQEQADLVRFQNAHAAGDAVIFGVRFDDPDTGPIQELMSKSGGKWPIVDDPNAKITYSVTGPPESFLVTPGGIVLAHVVGPVTNSLLEGMLNQAKLVVSTPVRLGPATSTP